MAFDNRSQKRRVRRTFALYWRFVRLTLARMAKGPRAYSWLFVGSIIESTLLPWPIEFPFVAVMLRGRSSVWPATFCVALGSALGGILMFWLGHGAASVMAGFVQNWAASDSGLSYWQDYLQAKGPWAVFFAMMTPVPVQVTTFAAGMAGLSWMSVVLAITLGRFVRYSLTGVLIYFFGEQIMTWWRSWPALYKKLTIFGFLVLFVLAMAWVLRP